MRDETRRELRKLGARAEKRGPAACIGVSEETRNAARHVPRAIWIALLSVAALVILNAVATTLAHPDPASVVAGSDADPVHTAVVSAFGSWSTSRWPRSCARRSCRAASPPSHCRPAMFSIARDGVLPGSRFLRRVDRRSCPIGAIVTTTVVACLGLLIGLNSAAVGSLIAFGTTAIYSP